MAVMHAALSEAESPLFQGLRIDTCANRTSVISINQYKAYCRQFNFPSQINKTRKKSLRGLGGTSEPIGVARIPVPFKDLNLVIDIKIC